MMRGLTTRLFGVMLGVVALVVAPVRSEASGYRVLHYFTYDGSSATGPGSGPTIDAAGNLFGSTVGGGIYGAGTVYRFTPAGKITVLASFGGRSFPMATPTLDRFGDVYQPTFEGVGFSDAYLDILSPTGKSLILSLYTIGVQSQLVFDHSNNLVGATSGEVFKVSPRTGLPTVLHNFPDGSGTDGNYVLPGRIAIDAHGNMYGGTLQGGAHNQGTIFRLSPSGQETVLYSFPDPYGCIGPNSGFIFDAAGNLYGATSNITAVVPSCIFRLSPSGNYTMLHQFNLATEGSRTNGDLLMDAKGNLYGTNIYQGPRGGGTLFKLAPDGKLTVLYAFYRQSAYPYQAPEGDVPNDVLAVDAAGNLYGTTASGGTYDVNGNSGGVLFEYSP